ncbi:MAG: DUF4124 domain-containing protein [Candidatus Thiodiazotropha sp.]
MRLIVLLSIFLLAQPLFARDVYKWVTEDGEVIYSENYRPGAESIRVHDDKRKARVNTDQLNENPDAATAGDYTDFAIVQPANNETLRSADASVSVGISLSPPLAEGHEIYLYVDGSQLKTPIKTTQLVLQNLLRGSHTLKAEIRDETGEVLGQTAGVNFNLRQEALE